MLRELIEVPSTFNMIKSNETVIHEVTLKNQNYIGIPLRQLPFIDQITINRIFRKGKIVQPTGDTTLQLNDRIIFFQQLARTDLKVIGFEVKLLN